MEQWDEALLGILIEIDEQIPTRQEIDLRERRVLDHALDGKDTELPDVLLDAVTIALANKEAFQAFGADIRRDTLGIQPLTGVLDDIRIDIRGEDLDMPRSPRALPELVEQHRHGVRFFSRRAGRDPDTQRRLLRWFSEPPSQQCIERAKHLAVAEEGRDADQQLREQETELVRMRREQGDIVRHRFDLVDAHAPLDAADHRRGLVPPEIVAATPMQEREHGVHGLGRRDLGTCEPTCTVSEASRVARDDGGHLLRRHHAIDEQGRRSAHRHARILSALLVLHDG
jgi:hypothetical protein